MAVKTPEEASASPPEWATIEQVFAALESPLLGGETSLVESVLLERTALLGIQARFDHVMHVLVTLFFLALEPPWT